MISLIGPAASTEYDIPVPTTEQQERLDSLYDAGRLSELVNPHSFLAALNADFPTPPATPWPRPRLGTLYWPVVGLAHYAFGTFVVDEYVLGQLRAQMTAAGSNQITVRFRDDPDNAGEVGRSVAMRFLSARPLVRTTSDPLLALDDMTADVDGWVVTLVDDRYRRLHSSLTSLDTTTWALLFATASVTVADAVDADYLTPGARWSVERIAGRSEAWLLDIAAMSVGSRIVSIPGASPQVQRPTPTRASALASAHTTAAADFRFAGGGPIEDDDVQGGMPNGVRVTFGTQEESEPVVVDSVIQTDYDWPTTAYLTHWADAPAASTSMQRTAIADQFADDWTAWQFDLYDTIYDGFVAAAQSGFLWAVVWEQNHAHAVTRFVRAPYWYGYLLAPQIGEDVVTYGCGLELSEDNELTVDLTAIAGDGLEVVAHEGDCDTLDVNLGCGLEFVDGAVSVKTNCGLMCDPDDGLSIDTEQLVGDAVDTALVDIPGASPSDCHTIGVDLEVDSTTSEYRISDVSLSFTSGGFLRLTKTRIHSTNSFNAAGLLIGREDDGTVTTETDIDLCAAIEHCGDGYILEKTLDDATLVATYITNQDYVLAKTLDNATLAATYEVNNIGDYTLAKTLDNATLAATYTVTDGYILESAAGLLQAATLVATYTVGGPGSDCASAESLTLGVSAGTTIPAGPGTFYWYKYLVGTSGVHKFTTTGVDGLNVSMLLYRNGSCPTPDLMTPDHFGPPCWDDTWNMGDTVWFKISNNTGSSAAVTIIVESGAC